MSELGDAIARLSSARSLQDVDNIANTLSAKASGPGGILYSGYSGDARSQSIALDIADQTGMNIIDDTQRGKFLNNPAVENALTDIISDANPNANPSVVQDFVNNYLYGGSSDSLWGQASQEYVASLSGNVTFVGNNASSAGIFTNVEAQGVIDNELISSLNGISRNDFPEAAQELVSSAEKSWSSALDNGGVYLDEDGNAITSSEVYNALALHPSSAETAETLDSLGFSDATSALLETPQAVEAEGILASLGGDALKLLTDVAGGLGGVVIDLLFNSTPLNAGEDQEIFNRQDRVLDTPEYNNDLSSFEVDNDGNYAVNSGLLSDAEKASGGLSLLVDSKDGSVSLATISDDNSQVFL